MFGRKMNNYTEIKNKKIGLCKPKVCVPLVARTEDEILAACDEIVGFAQTDVIDIVEFRADYYEKLDDFNALQQLLKKVRERLGDIILLFTIRSEKEGGEKLSFEAPDINTINRFVVEKSLADMVDVELFSGDEIAASLTALAHEKDVKIIMSNHDFNTTPEKDVIVKRLRRMQELGADIVKIAVMPENKLQLLELLTAVAVMNEEYARVPVVAISMGSLGAVSRITGEVFGSAITFASLNKGSAPGQIPVNDINRILEDIHKYCV